METERKISNTKHRNKKKNWKYLTLSGTYPGGHRIFSLLSNFNRILNIQIVGKSETERSTWYVEGGWVKGAVVTLSINTLPHLEPISTIPSDPQDVLFRRIISHK